MNVSELLESLSEKEIEKYKLNAIEMPTYAGEELDEIVIKLEKLRRQGKLNYFAKFNGKELYSVDVTMDSAFKECLDCTRKTWLKRQLKWAMDAKIQIEKAKAEAEEKLPYWIEEGKKYIHPEKYELWEKTCTSSANGDYYGCDVAHAIEVMDMLKNKKDFSEIKEKVENSGHSGMTYSRTMDIILMFAPLGPDFYNFMNKSNMSMYDRKYSSRLKEINKKLDKGLTYKQAKEEVKRHKIMDIHIQTNSFYESGTILINKDLTFEGLIDDDEINIYLTGKITEDGTISFVEISDFRVPSHYCAIREGYSFVGRREAYTPNNIKIDFGLTNIRLVDSKKDFKYEILIQSLIASMKKHWYEITKLTYDYFERHFDEETERMLSIVKSERNEQTSDDPINVNSRKL